MGAAPFPAVISTKLGGSWRKDKANSDVDCYARQLDLLEVQGIQKACAMKLINGLQIDSDEERKLLYWCLIAPYMVLCATGAVLSTIGMPVKRVSNWLKPEPRMHICQIALACLHDLLTSFALDAG